MADPAPDTKSLRERVDERREAQGPFFIGGFVTRAVILLPVLATTVAALALMIWASSTRSASSRSCCLRQSIR